jgi:hypothetical protein
MALRKRRRLQDAYRFPGLQPLAPRGVFGDPQVRIVQLMRRHAPARPVLISTQPAPRRLARYRPAPPPPGLQTRGIVKIHPLDL